MSETNRDLNQFNNNYNNNIDNNNNEDEFDNGQYDDFRLSSQYLLRPRLTNGLERDFFNKNKQPSIDKQHIFNRNYKRMGSEFLGKRMGSEFLGKRMGSEFLGKRMGSEFLG